MSRDTTHLGPVMAIIAGVALTLTACGTSPGDHPGSAVPKPVSNTATTPVTASPETSASRAAGSPVGLRVGGVPFPMPPAGSCHAGTRNGQPLPGPALHAGGHESCRHPRHHREHHLPGRVDSHGAPTRYGHRCDQSGLGPRLQHPPRYPGRVGP